MIKTKSVFIFLFFFSCVTSYSVPNSIDVDVSAVIFNPIDEVTAISCIGSITANKRRDVLATGAAIYEMHRFHSQTACHAHLVVYSIRRSQT